MPDANANASWKHVFDPFDKELIAAPHPRYRLLRAEDPVHWSPPIRAWVLSRMEDVQAVLNDSNFTALECSRSLSELARRANRNFDASIRVLDAMLFFEDGARHQHDRRSIAKVLNRLPLSQLEPRIEEIALFLSSELSGLASYDAIEKFAEPMPQLVMAHILGLPPSDVPVLNELLAQMTLLFDPAVTLEACEKINEKVAAALALFESRIAESLKGSSENGLSILHDGASGSESAKLANAAATALFTFRVGAETTIGLLGLLIRTLAQQPSLRQSLREDPSLAPTLVSEVLRLESNVQRSVRVCRETRVIGGKTIRPGDRLMVLLGAANRDPAIFDEPDKLDVIPRSQPDVAFGGGPHFCLGASLARLEGRIVLEHFARLPAIETTGQEEWYPGRTIRRLTRLPVRVAGPIFAGADRFV
jgi:cytochrome P450